MQGRPPMIQTWCGRSMDRESKSAGVVVTFVPVRAGCCEMHSYQKHNGHSSDVVLKCTQQVGEK